MSEPAVAGRVAERLLAWFDRHGRHDLPWQHPRSAYRVWLSEVMLQQTQVTTVIPYFLRFVQHFPDIASLARASSDEVLQHWAGLGYYARARNLHRAATLIVQNHGGEMPQHFAEVLALPGVGRSTAGAILAQAFGQRHPIMDGNVKRVLSRFHAVAGALNSTAVLNQLWAFAQQHTPQHRVGDYCQAIMDLGAMLCTRSRPQCDRCPLVEDCAAFRHHSPTHFPQRIAKPERPKRSLEMLILQRDDGAILLQRRPSVGLWGGLWSLPETAEAEQRDGVMASYGLTFSEARQLTSIRHRLTHIDLHILPVVLPVKESGTCIRERQDILWQHLGETLPGVPTPVRMILQQLAATRHDPARSVHQTPT